MAVGFRMGDDSSKWVLVWGSTTVNFEVDTRVGLHKVFANNFASALGTS